MPEHPALDRVTNGTVSAPAQGSRLDECDEEENG